MLGLIITVALVVTMYRIAEADGLNGLIWGGITLVLALLVGWLIPVPLVGIIVTGVGVFLAMIGCKVVTER